MATLDSSTFSADFAWATLATRFRWVSITPFGRPVVPLEKGRATRSVSGSMSTFGASSGFPMSEAKGVAPSGSPNTKSSSMPASAAAFLAVSRKGGAVSRKRA